MTFKEGEVVINQKAPGWGKGKIIEVIGNKYRIYFENGGEKVVGALATLENVSGDNVKGFLKPDFSKLKVEFDNPHPETLLSEKQTRWFVEKLEISIIESGVKKGRGNFADASGSTHSPELYCFETGDGTLYVGFVKIAKYCSLYTGRFENHDKHTKWPCIINRTIKPTFLDYIL